MRRTAFWAVWPRFRRPPSRSCFQSFTPEGRPDEGWRRTTRGGKPGAIVSCRINCARDALKTASNGYRRLKWRADSNGKPRQS
ncbi:hypothetical protein ppKF707_3901 [Metapseudomonas furukawaii]|uniref:Uncharacterized protein n=1 Tax=Metapseudomonas furukawaii TaxID=1149133 RepID=A0AAD1BZ34_METFU|nr:hypothetical protein ppKF707_3901 [Pseudomonas furukawaii]BAU73686.1 hypothetical protein KF707C_19980 [Pseudomonas furukawaii]